MTWLQQSDVCWGLLLSLLWLLTAVVQHGCPTLCCVADWLQLQSGMQMYCCCWLLVLRKQQGLWLQQERLLLLLLLRGAAVAGTAAEGAASVQ
jgi:hypothetical protein